MKFQYFIILILLGFFVTDKALSQQSSLQQMLNSAKSIKKNSPAQNNNPAQQGPPAGHDVSWKVMVNFTRTMTATADLTSLTTATCRQTKKGIYNLTVSGDFQSDKTDGWINEDDFTLETYGDVDDQLKPFLHPFKGSFTGNSSGNNVEKTCGDVKTTELTANGNVDLAALRFSFLYNRKKKQGSISFTPESNYRTDANAKVTFSGKSGSGTANTSEVAKAEFNLMFGTNSNFSILNYAVTKDARTEQQLQSSPINGGLGSIGETKYGYDISYSETKTIDDVPEGWTGTSRITYTTSVHIQISNQDPPQYDAIVQAVDYPSLLETNNYQSWIPEGPPIPDTARHDKRPSPDDNHGNSIAFRVYIVDKKNPNLPITGRKYRVEFLLNSSRIKGICMNYPQEKDADNKPDLIFDSLFQKTAQAGQEPYANDALRSNEDSGENFIAIITSYDYGSYGALKVKVTIKDDFGVTLPPVWAHLKNDKTDSISIPYDQNHNHIADEWEKQMGILGKNLKSNSDDDDLPAGLNKDFKGDGYTAYEEYRGFSEEAKHIRTDPTTRDVMVCNTLEDVNDKPYKTHAENGISLYQGVTGLNVHFHFRPEEFGRHLDVNPDQALFNEYQVKSFLYDKVINFNYSDKSEHSVDQHGILISFTPQQNGSCAAVPKTNGDLIGTPGNYAFLYIAADFDPGDNGYYVTRGNLSKNGKLSSDPNGTAKIITDFYAVCVAHEMLHCSNVPHHGDNDMWHLSYTPSDDKTSITFIGQRILDDEIIKKTVRLFYNQKEVLPTDPRLVNKEFIDELNRKILGVQNGEESGNEDCIMRYSVAGMVEKNDIHSTLPGVKDFNQVLVKENKNTLTRVEYELNLQFTGTSLCSDATGTGLNGAPNHYFGNAVNGNCKSRVKVKDKKE